GGFREDVDEKLLLSTIIGSLVAYEAIEGKAMDDDTAWASRMADLLWPALLK
ncbi:TetR/AcrR family transcriptional regulator, partial [Bifidobacterium longum]